MMTKSKISLALLAAAVMAGCSTVPESQILAEARSQYDSARSNPEVARLAALELKEAGDALARANAAQADKSDVSKIDSLAYVAKQKVSIARASTDRKLAEEQLAQAADERSKVQLDMRTAEADRARQEAALAQQSEAEKSAALAAAQAAASTQASQYREQLAATEAEADAARKQAADAQANANQSAAALAQANADTAANNARLQAVQAQLDEMEAKKTERGMVITLGDVLFDTGKAQLKAGATRNVQKLADFMKQYPERRVQIEGFTDSVGQEEYNQVLSQQRADAVRAALTSMGVESARIDTQGYGETLPVASNDTKAGRQLNRRVEIVLSDEQGKIGSR